MPHEGIQFNDEPSPEKERMNKLKALILTPEQYRDHPFAHLEGDQSYVVECGQGEKKLVFFGSPHTNDPENPIFIKIREKFEEVGPEIVYVEGMKENPSLHLSLV
jgi:hypothetical protein